MADDSSGKAVHFGVDRYVDALTHRLERYFDAQRRDDAREERAVHGPSRGDQALVVGIYGPWGCGKTTWLRRIEGKFRERQRRSVDRGGALQRITVPVFFNAWQFEREPHLVVPMLKTAEASVRRFLNEHAPEESTSGVWRWARESGLMLGDAALALASGLKGELSFGGIGGGTTGAKIEVDPGKSIETFMARRKERKESEGAVPSPLEAYESLYFDLRSTMRALTGRGERPEAWRWIEQAQQRIEAQEQEREKDALEVRMDRLGRWSLGRRRLQKQLAALEQSIELQRKEHKALTDGSKRGANEGDAKEGPDYRLDLLFLIDDLDRCLPEKAVEVLESIKLFLEVPGCAFVLGVDDEVIERGILHRYRDYVFDSAGESLADAGGSNRGAPISGAEYLEKIVHLPVRVPPLVEAETRVFLQQEYPELFRSRARRPEHRVDERTEVDGRQREVDGEERGGSEWNVELLDLFERCVPGVPRKLIRAAELFAVLDEVARELVEQRRFGESAYEPVLLARLVLLQLFAPEVYRLGAWPEGRAFLAELQGLVGVGLDPEIKRLERCLQAEDPLGDDESVSIMTDDGLLRWRKDQQRLRLARCVRQVLQQRSRFDARLVVGGDDGYEWRSRVASHYRLIEEKDPEASAGGLLTRGHAGRVVQIEGVARGTSTASASLESVSNDVPANVPVRPRRRSGRPNDLRGFMAFALSESSEDWTRGIAQEDEQLRGRVFDEATFDALVERVGERGDAGARVTMPWLRTFIRYLEPDQIVSVIRESKLLGRLSEPDAQEEPLDAIELACREINPPYRPGSIPIRLREMLPEGKTLDLRTSSVRWRHLVGLDGAGAQWPEAGIAWRGTDSRESRLASTMEPAHPPHSISVSLGRGPVWGMCTLGEDRLASGGSDGMVRVWRASDGTLLQTLEGHRGGVFCVCALGEDWLASGGDDGTVRVWRASGGTLPQTFKGHKGGVTGVCALGEDRVASGGDDGTVRVWRALDGTLLHTLKSHNGRVWGVCALSEDRVVSGGDDGTVRVWRASDGTLLQTLKGHNGGVLSVCVLGEGRLVSGGDDETVRVWQASDGMLLQTLEGHNDGVLGVCVLGEDRVVSGGSDGTVRVWRASDGMLLQTLEGHRDWVRGVCALGEDRLASGGSDGTVRVWRGADGMLLQTLEGHRDWVRGMCALGGGQLVSGGSDETVRVWRASDGTVRQTLEGHNGDVLSVCVLGEDRLASGGSDGTVRVWRASDGTLLQTLGGHRRHVLGVCALGEDRLASGGADGTVRVWRASDGTPLQTLQGHRNRVLGVCALGEDWLASGGSDGTVRVWRASDGTLLQTLQGFQARVWSVCALGEDRLASGGSDGTVRVWGASDGVLSQTLKGHRSHVFGVCALGEDRLASGGADGTVRVWRASDGTLLQTLKSHNGRVSGVCALGEDRLASGGDDGTVRVWRASDGTLLLRLQSKPMAAALTLHASSDAVWPIILSRSTGPWRLQMHGGIPLPADPQLHQLVAFITRNVASPHPNDSIRVPIHAIPAAYGEQWTWSDDKEAIRFKWPLDPAAKRALRHYAFGKKYAAD